MLDTSSVLYDGGGGFGNVAVLMATIVVSEEVVNVEDCGRSISSIASKASGS